MQKLFRLALATVLISGCASLAAAGDLKLTLSNGRVTLIAQDVPLRQILDEWARVGKTTIVNADKLNGPPMTLQLVDRPEREVLDLLLRVASGYIAAPRTASIEGGSVFERVMILPVSHGPVGAAANTPPTPFNNNRAAMNMAMPSPVPPDNDDPEPQQQVMPPGMIVPNGSVQNPAQALPPGQQPQLTSPRPGMLPAPPAGQPNPYAQPTAPGTQPQQPTVPGIQAPVPGAIPPPFIRPPGGPGGPGGV
jgi:hypothetical protein